MTGEFIQFCICISALQSIGTDEGATVITKSLIFYVAITLEAFVFCYAGEYLSAKVSAGKRNGSVVEFFKFRRFALISESKRN